MMTSLDVGCFPFSVKTLHWAVYTAENKHRPPLLQSESQEGHDDWTHIINITIDFFLFPGANESHGPARNLKSPNWPEANLTPVRLPQRDS